MKVCVIGAGAAGLCALRHTLACGMEVTAYEQSNEIGGTWVYTDDIGRDKYGLDVHSSMYKGLYTNLPKEIMHYPDYPFPADDENSYLSAEDVLKYYQSYADKFNLRGCIKFEHHVVRVRPLQDDTWEIIVRDLRNERYEIVNYDAVLVCNGHYNTPLIPDYEGRREFQGKQIHSHDYRCSEPYKNEKVLIIGSGPSGRDAILDFQKTTKHVTWSHHLTNENLIKLRENVTQKPDVLRLTKDGAIFIDGSYQDFTLIVYCTGYRYNFPFLSADCGLIANDNCVEPLYKHCININKPTMAVIGLPTTVCPNQMFDLQVRFYLAFLASKKEFPSKEVMLEDLEYDRRTQFVERKLPKNKFHYLGIGYHEKYYDSMAELADVDSIEPVIIKMFEKGMTNLFQDFLNFRNEVFKVIDSETFITVTKKK